MAASKRPRGTSLRALLGLFVAVGGLVVLFSAERRRGGAEAGSRQAEPETDQTRAIGHGRAERSPSSQALADGYEPRDASARALGIVMVVSVATIAIAITGLFLFLRVLHSGDAVQPPLTARQRTPVLPPGPPLQSDPQKDLAVFKVQDMAKLQGYRWRDPEHRRAQIPLERAMTIVLGTPLDPPR